MTDHIHTDVCSAQLDYNLNWKGHVAESQSNVSSDIMIHFTFFRISLSLR